MGLNELVNIFYNFMTFVSKITANLNLLFSRYKDFSKNT